MKQNKKRFWYSETFWEYVISKKEVMEMDWQSFADGLIVASIAWTIFYVVTLSKL